MRRFIEVDAQGNVTSTLEVPSKKVDNDGLPGGGDVLPPNMIEVTVLPVPDHPLGWHSRRWKGGVRDRENPKADDFEPRPPEPDQALDPNSIDARLTRIEAAIETLVAR